MAKRKQALTDTQIRKIKKPGRYIDGDGLHMVATEGASGINRKWVCRITVAGKRRDIGLGPYPLVTLSEARETTMEFRRMARQGRDPVEERRARQGVLTFRQAAAKVHQSNLRTWKNDKHQAQWINTLETYAYPHIGDKRVSDVTTPDILDVLAPVWIEKRETAQRVRQRMATVFDWCATKGYVSSNPVTGVTRGLPARKKRVKHMAAMPYADLPDYVADIRREDSSVSALALEFTILTAARTGETIGAVWSEIDLEKALWSIPTARMKAENEHRVPLSERALEILETVRPLSGEDGGFVFPSPLRKSRPLSNMAMLNYLKRTHPELTVHGFRSSFRDWASEQTGFPHAAIERCLAHAPANKVEAAYARSDLLERRREIMNAWTAYLTQSVEGAAGKVVTLSAR